MQSRLRQTILLVGVVALLAGMPGCETPPKAVPQPRAVSHEIWMFPGVGAGKFLMTGPRHALRAALPDATLHFYHWDRPLIDVLGHLQKYEANRAHAARAAEEITEAYCERQPVVIDLVGYSGGGGIALMVAEVLPPDVRVRNVVLVQPGVSPTWDLTRTLRVVDGHLVNFYCRTDWLILGLGTAAFGTVDRENVASAGKDGFDVETAVPEPDMREKLIQRGWEPEMLRTGHFGNHTGIISRAWNKEYVAAYLRSP